MMATNEELLKDIADRMAAIETTASEAKDAVTDDKLRAFVAEYLGDLKDDDPLVRKMRFGNEGDSKLKGSKYSHLDGADVEFLYNVQESFRGMRKSPDSSDPHPGASEELTRAYQAVASGTRAMDTAESGYGQQLMGAQYGSDLWAAVRGDSRVFDLIPSFEMTEATAYLPVEVDFPEMLLLPESTTYNASEYATSKTGSNRVQITPSKFGVHQKWSAELEEDSIIPLIPHYRRQLTIGLAHQLDSAVLNGDTTSTATGNINSDDEAPAATKHFLAFDGIRHAGLVDNTGNSKSLGAAIDLAALAASRGRMFDKTYLHDWGHPSDPSDLVYVADPSTADAIAALDPVMNSRIYNGGADLLSGEVSRILGHPVISSAALSLTEADGKVSYDTPANNTKGQIAAFNRRGFIVGWRRAIRSESERLLGTDQYRMVTYLRVGFGRFTPTGAASGIESADVIYNISL